MVVRGPYTAIPAAARSRPLTPTSRLPGHTPKMVPTAKLVSMMDDPSRGSNATEYPCDPSNNHQRKSHVRMLQRSALGTTSFAHPTVHKRQRKIKYPGKVRCVWRITANRHGSKTFSAHGVSQHNPVVQLGLWYDYLDDAKAVYHLRRG